MNALEKVIASIVAILLMFIIPVSYFQIKKDNIVQVTVDKNTSSFVEMVSTQGYVTRGMYEKYLKDLSETGKLYSVALEHELIAFEPEYKFRTPGEVVVEDESTWTGVNEYYEASINTTVPIVTDPVDNSGTLNTETTASVLAAAVNTPALASHVHTDTCFDGHRHTDGTGITVSDSYHGCYITPVYGSVSCTGTYQGGTSAGNYTTTASCDCGRTVTAYATVYNYSCSAAGHTASSIATFATWSCVCGRSGSLRVGSGNMSGNYCSSSTSTVTGYKCDLVEDTTPYCSEVVEIITPTHLVQTVAIGDSIITSVIVTYRDGSTKVFAGTTVFNTMIVGKNQTATLTYSYTLFGVSSTKTNTVTVSVIPRSKTCVNGHVYNLNGDGSDPGCIYCHSWLVSLSVYAPPGGQLTMYRNPSGTLETEGVGLMANYLDGHTEYVYNGYLDNLDPDYVGTQTVTIGYKGLLTSLQAIILRNRIQCGTCRLFYDMYLDSSDPGCPFCKARVPVFTGNVMEYCKATYEDEILTELYEGSGTYYFRRGDTFTVNAESKSKIAALSLIGRLSSLQIKVNKKDTIKDEFLYK